MDNLLNENFYEKFKIKIFGIMLVSLFLGNIISLFVFDYLQINNFKDNWINIYNQNISMIQECLDNRDDVYDSDYYSNYYTKSNELIAYSFNTIIDSNDEFEDAEILLLNRLNNTKDVFNVLASTTDEEIINEGITELETIIKRNQTTINVLNKLNLFNQDQLNNI